MARFSFAKLGVLLLAGVIGGCSSTPAEPDASVTDQNLKALYPFAYPVGPAGGDLGTTYPNPKVEAISGTSPIPITPNVLQWVNSASPQITQAALGGAGTGANLTIAPQGANTAGASGSVVVNIQAPASGTAEAGINLQRATTSFGWIQPLVSTPTSIAIYGPVAPSATNYALNASSTITNISGPSTLQLNIANTLIVQMTSGSFSFIVPTVTFGSTIVSPTFSQATRSSDNATQTLKVAAQSAFASATGTNRNGGTLQLTGGLATGVGAGVGGVIQANSGLAYRILNVSTATYTVDTNATASDLTIFTDSGANTVAITLPTPTAGRIVWVKDKTGKAATHNVSILPHAAETIDGAASLVFTKNFDAAMLESDGTNWSIMSEFSSSIVP